MFTFFRSGQRPSYEHLIADSGDDEIQLGRGSKEAPQTRWLSRPSRTPWIISTVIFATLFLGTVTIQLRRTPPLGSFETGFTSENEFIWPAIELESVAFTGGLIYDDNGTLHRNIAPGQPQYVGPPSPDIDEAWERLIEGRYVAFTEEESTKLGEDMYQEPDTGLYRAGVDVLHTLHCINKIRMGLDNEYYHDAEKEGPENYRLHLDHCLDYLRQIVQCSSDLTPMPIIWAEGAGRAVPNFEQKHVCRNFQKIRQWATEKEEKTTQTVTTR